MFTCKVFSMGVIGCSKERSGGKTGDQRDSPLGGVGLQEVTAAAGDRHKSPISCDLSFIKAKKS